jgi:hypothetical protein
MARTPKMNEGILSKLWGLLKTTHKRGKFYMAMQGDAKLKRYTKEFEKATKDLENAVQNRRKESPAFAHHYDKWSKIYDWYVIGNKSKK